jgi:hypothetical protein
MDERHRRNYLRAAVFVVLFLLHGGLVLVFLRENPAYRDNQASPEVPTILFFINPRPRLPLPPPETSLIAHRPTRDLPHRLRPDAAVSSLDTTAPSENQGSAASAPVDWLAEAHRSVSEIASLGDPGRAAQSPSAPTASAPWDSRPLLEFTGHGLQVRIPVEIPGTIIDHCFGNMDLGHNRYGDTGFADNPTGSWELYQLKCAFRKQPARGDLFDSLRKPSEPLK